MKIPNVTQSRCHTVTRNMKKPNETQNAKRKRRADALTRPKNEKSKRHADTATRLAGMGKVILA